tara:strand:- start:263 stop:574 length:312 start_codon:yes stop_codon:yes gene_type:complete
MVNFTSKLMTNSRGKPSKQKKAPKMSRGTRAGDSVPGNRAVKKKAPVAPNMYGYANQGIKGNSVSNAKKPNYKKAVQADTKKKKRMERGRKTHDAAKKLMGFK